MSDSAKQVWGGAAVQGVVFASVLGIFAWFGQDYLAEFRDDIASIAGRVQAIDSRVDDHEVRITSREADKFTAQDGLRLEARISENALMIAQLAKADSEFKILLKEDVAELKSAMQRVWHEVRKK